MIKKLILNCGLLIFLGMPSGAQLWTGVLDTNHATDWTKAGVTAAYTGHSSSYTQCAALSPGVTAATISSTLAGCAANTYVLLQAGTYNLAGGIAWSKSNVVLRGAGANQTILVFSAGGSCNGLAVTLCINGPNLYPGVPPPGINWTAGYAAGTTQVTLASTAGISTGANTLLFFDQCDTGTTGAPCAGTVTDNGQLYACSVLRSSATTGCGNEVGSNAYRPLRSQMQGSWATAINGNVVTLQDPIVAPNWSAGQTPQVWIYPNAVVGSGVEDLTIDNSTANVDAILLYGCANCWVTGNRIVNTNKRSIWVAESVHVDVQFNYIFGAQNVDPYCFDPNYTTYVKYESNISQRCRSQLVWEGPGVGNVISYNYTINDQDNPPDSRLWDASWTHSATSNYSLWEGNIMAAHVWDDIHGAHFMHTLYRNYFIGWESTKTTNTHAVAAASFSRYMHVIGNVLGRVGVHTAYQSLTSGVPDNTIYVLDYGSTPTDAVTHQTLTRWGNWDNVTNAVRWCGNSSDTGWVATCASTSEVPTGLAVLPLSVPTKGDTGAGQAIMPASFYLSSKPSWWNTEPWPPIGPEITTGTVYGSDGGATATAWNIQAVGGHANNIPSQDCYKNIMNGPADGSGSALTYSRVACFNITGISPTVLGPWTIGEAVSQLFTCSSCGAGSWSSAGVFPTGLSFNSATGTLSGTIGGTAGTFTPSVSFSTSTNNYSIVVNAAAGISTNSPLPSAIQGQSYTPGGITETLTITNGTGISTCAITAGSLIGSSLTLNSNCTITGTAGNPGLYSFTITPTDANGVAGSPKAFQLNVLSSNLVGGSKVEGHVVVGGAAVSQ